VAGVGPVFWVVYDLTGATPPDPSAPMTPLGKLGVGYWQEYAKDAEARKLHSQLLAGDLFSDGFDEVGCDFYGVAGVG
jgi:hypothetical protein